MGRSARTTSWRVLPMITGMVSVSFLRSLMMGSCLFPTVVYMKQDLSKIQSMKT